jgi:hypothetical protein
MMNRYYATKTAPNTCQEDDPLTDAEHIRWMEIIVGLRQVWRASLISLPM